MLTEVAWRTVGTGLPIKHMPLATRYQIGERRLIPDSRSFSGQFVVMHCSKVDATTICTIFMDGHR